MQVCPVCEGRTITARIVDSEPDAVLTEAGLFAVTATLIDQPCQTCGGAGRVSDLTFFRLTHLPDNVE